MTKPAGRVLVIKTSSFGDVVHTLPALTDAAMALPGVEFDWVVEPAFAPVAALHPAVRRVIPLAMRQLRRPTREIIGGFVGALHLMRSEQFDVVIDVQGLMKSAAVTLLARGPRHGFGHQRAREPLATLAYQHRHALPGDTHVVDLNRRLFAAALAYSMPATPARYGLDRLAIAKGRRTDNIMLAHGAAWPDKLWPVAQWIALARQVAEAGFTPLLPYQGDSERLRAEDIIKAVPQARLQPPLSLAGLVEVVAGCAGLVAGDTGLAHLADALDLPVVALFGPSTPKWSGVRGEAAVNVEAPMEACALRPCMARRCKLAPQIAIAPCMAAIEAGLVWQHLNHAIESKKVGPAQILGQK